MVKPVQSGSLLIASVAVIGVLAVALIHPGSIAAAADPAGGPHADAVHDGMHIARLRTNPVRTYNLSNPESTSSSPTAR